MNYRILGKTGLKISEIGFGCIPIIRLSATEAVQVLRHGFDKGITYYDTANAYADSEAKIGKALNSVRHQVVLATKTLKRDGAGVWEHLHRSLEMLQTDYIDLYQIHQVAQETDWEAVTAPGGALEAILKAKEQGKIRHIGITTHSLTMALKLVKTDLFATIMFPFNFIEDAAKDLLNKEADNRHVGMIAMKPFAGGVIPDGELAFKFLRQHPTVIPIPGFDSVAGIDQILALYGQPNVVTPADVMAMNNYRLEIGSQFCRRCEYCQPCPNGVLITPAMGYPIIAHRMSPAVAVAFAKKAMESVPQCIDCGICATRCPYTLPIPELLKKNYALYESQLKSLS
jgi:hypothetical protein